MTQQFKFRNIPAENLDLAVKCIRTFVKDFPDRFGSYHGVGFMVDGVSFYVYRTGTMVVCVGQGELRYE